MSRLDRIVGQRSSHSRSPLCNADSRLIPHASYSTPLASYPIPHTSCLMPHTQYPSSPCPMPPYPRTYMFTTERSHAPSCLPRYILQLLLVPNCGRHQGSQHASHHRNMQPVLSQAGAALMLRNHLLVLAAEAVDRPKHESRGIINTTLRM